MTRQRLVKRLAHLISSVVVLVIVWIIAINLLADNPPLLSIILLVSIVPTASIAGHMGALAADYAEYKDKRKEDGD